MGTNYYVTQKVTENEAKYYKELAEKEQWDKLKIELQDTDQIHIGKSSFGWKFCFDHNDWKYFNEDKQEVIAFINSCNIVDEYGDEVSHEKFWKMVDDKSDGLDMESYYEKNPNEKVSWLGVSDLYVEDLRFSSSTGFS